MPRKKAPKQHPRLKPIGSSGLKTIHVGGWENEYRPYCQQPGDERPPEVSPPDGNAYNPSHGAKRHEPANPDPAVTRANQADWRNRRITKPPTV